MPTSSQSSARIATAVVRMTRADPTLDRNVALTKATALERAGRLRDDGSVIERVPVPREGKEG